MRCETAADFATVSGDESPITATVHAREGGAIRTTREPGDLPDFQMGVQSPQKIYTEVL